MLFNKSNNGAEELQERTGSYYANNDFARIVTDIELAEDDLIKLVGQAVYDRALNHYEGDNYLSDSEDHKTNNMLVKLIQTAVAYKATFEYYQSNLVSHEDTGRKVKIDNDNEKMAWEWMLDRDDQAQLSKINRSIDRLINWLETKKIEEWIDSENRKATKKLLVNSQDLFQQAYPIDHSPRFFYTVLSWNREVQENKIRKALGASYAPLLAFWKSKLETSGSGSGSAAGGLPGQDEALMESLLPLVQQVIPLFVMAVAVKRLSLQVLPDSVVQQYQSDRAARSSSMPALTEIIDWHVKRLKDDAELLLDDIKQILQLSDPEANIYPLQPTNDERKRFFRT